MRAVIIGAGAISDYAFFDNCKLKDDFIICADGGYDHSIKMGLIPNLIVGDFDSLKSGLPKDIETIIYPSEKDETDTFIATKIALERGFKDILYLGCLGNRLDHTVANITMLKYVCDKGASAQILDKKNTALIISSETEIKGEKGLNLSLIPIFGDAVGVTTKGLYYKLMDYTIIAGSSLGISNVFLSNTATINIKSGYLLCILSKD